MKNSCANGSGSLGSNEIVPTPPKKVSRRNLLSTIGAMSAGVVVPGSIGGLGLMASGVANAAVTPVGTLKLRVATSTRTVSPGVNETTYEEYYYRTNAAGNKEVNAYRRTKTVYSNPPRTVDNYTFVGGSERDSTNTFVFASSGYEILRFKNSNLRTTGVGKCRRLNASGTENIATAFAINGMTILATVASQRMGNAAAEYSYIKYRRSADGSIFYRFFLREGAAAAGQLATVLLPYTTGTATNRSNIDAIISGFATMVSEHKKLVVSSVTSAVLTAAGVTIGKVTSVTGSAMVVTSSAVLAAVAAGGVAYSNYRTFGEAAVKIGTLMGAYGTSAVSNTVDCV